MKLSKVFAGMSALALAASMATMVASADTDIKYDPNATQTVIEVEDPDTGAWKNPMGEAYIDFHTLPRDTALTITLELKLSDTFLGMLEAGITDGTEQIGVAPTSMTPTLGWKHLGEEAGFITGDFPIGAELAQLDGASDGTYKLKAKTDDEGNPKLDKDGNVRYEEDVYQVADDSKMADLYMKPDGFIKWSDDAWKDWGSTPQTLTFTMSADCVNFILDQIEADMASDPEKNQWGGFGFQCSGNFELYKITIDHGNILTSTQYLEWLENAEEGAVWGPSGDDASSEETGSTDESKDDASTGDASSDDGSTASQGDASTGDSSAAATDSTAATTGNSGNSTASTGTSTASTGSSTTASNSGTTTASNGTAATTNSSADAANTTNQGTGAAAGIALAGIALAGAALVVTKKH